MNRSTLAERDRAIVHEILAVRDKLQEILDNKTQRGRRRSQYDAELGHRPLKPEEVKAWLKHSIARLNAAVIKHEDSNPKPWEWDKFENKW